MLESLTLKNFRKHVDRTFLFSENLNYVQGRNEAGKSTMISAIAYALFGTKALSESISEVVTYGQPANSLEVTLTFKFDGVRYVASRSPKGAEINYGDKKVTGQTETRLFIEKLFGATSDIIMSLQFATQNNVRGILAKGGSAAASELVETLADLKVIEALINKIQTDLPSGNTKALESSLATVRNTVVDVPPEPDQGPVSEAETALNQAQNAYEVALAASKGFDRAGIDAELAKAAAVVAGNAEKRKLVAQLESQLGLPESEPAVSKNTIQVWKEETAAASGNALRRKHYATERRMENIQRNRSDFTEAYSSAKANVDSLYQETVSAAAKLTDLRKHKPGTLSCPTCKREFPDAADIAAHDKAIAQQTVEADTQWSEWQNALTIAKDTLIQLDKVADEDRQIERLFNTDYWKHDTSVIPRAVEWIGAIPPATDPTYPIKEAEDAWAKHDRQIERHATVSAQIAGISFDEEIDTGNLQEQKRGAELALETVQSAERKVSVCRLEYQQAKSSFEHAVQSRDAGLRRVAEQREQVAQLEATLNKMGIHNDLIKALREARPQITAQLWNTVLGAVSHYFTSGRGVESVVTRDSDGFKVNGKPVDGLSGSTLDMLGLAIRLALSKVFLPNVGFILLDESFHGCDSDREMQGLQTITSANFDQIIMVSHSPQGESLATNLIQL